MGRHFIFTSGRSGSNYLSNTLNESPDCINFGEILGEWTLPYKIFGKRIIRTYDTARYFDFVYENRAFYYLAQIYSAYSHLRSSRSINFKSRATIESFGIKDFLVTLERRNGLNYLRENPDIKIIHLTRKNLLKRYISSLHMKNSKIASSYRKLSIKPLVVETENMVKSLEIFNEETKRERTFIESLTDHEIMHVEHEEYFASEKSIVQTNSRIFEFLGVVPAERLSRQQKILPNKLSDVVENYEDVVESLESTSYEQYIY